MSPGKPRSSATTSTPSATNGGQTFLSGTASKGACQWLNFYRNVNLTADGGAGGYVYHVIKKQPGTTIDVPGFDDSQIVGVVFRYYLYRPIVGTRGNAAIEELYKNGKTNPATLEIVGTFAPLLASEKILTTPIGRLMVSNTARIPTPTGSRNNSNGFIALAPTVLQVNGDLVSADFSGTFPDYYQAGANPKFDFGPVSLAVSGSAGAAVIGPVDYANAAAGDQRGWVFDFDISANQDAQKVPGNFLFTFSINDEDTLAPAGYPPKSYSIFMNPPFITNAPSISLRILPNDEDFSKYYVDPGADEPVGNDLLTFDVVYQKSCGPTIFSIRRESGFPAQFRDGCDLTGQEWEYPGGHRSGHMDVDSLHAADSRHVRQP